MPRLLAEVGTAASTVSTAMLLAILLTPLGMVSGCFGGNDENVDMFVQRVKKEQGGKIEPIPEVQEYKAYSYDAMALKSPFEPSSGFLAHKNADGEGDSRPDAARVRDDLEEFPLDSFKMVGILKRETQIWGLIVDTKGMIHRIREGNYLGQNSGRVDKITNDSIYISETISDGQGGWMERVSTLTMTE